MRTIHKAWQWEGRLLNKNKLLKTRITAGLVIVIFSLSMFISPAAYAAEPTVSVDETLYVNLDYYGRISEVNIVKGYGLNGLTEFEDYGDYEAVSNMSNYDQPVIENGRVRWNLKNTDKRFYANYKVKNDAIELPWSIDVSYKLNGVPCKADTLAGASGIIEIDIVVKPNDKAKQYYKNNMMLQAATYVDMEDTYSLDAPGSQIQSVGTYKAVVFFALPGETDTFTIRIGTESFETKGITMMMIPGTMKQLEDIEELKEAKDTLYDSFNTIYISMNDVLNTMNSMKEGLSELQSGTEGMEDARSSFSSGKDLMNEYADTALGDISAANAQLKNVIPYFRTGKKMIKSIGHDVDQIVDVLDDLKDPLDDSTGSISTMRRNLQSLDSMLDQLDTQIEASLRDLGMLIATPESGATLYDGAQLQELAELAAVLGNYSSNISSLLTEMRGIGETTTEIMNISQDLIDETDDLNDTLNYYQDDMTDLLNDCRDLTTLLNKSIDSTTVFLTYTKSLLKTSGDKLDKAAESSLKGISDVLGKSIDGLGSIPAMRNANNTIKKTIDKEFNKFEDENKFLNIDADAELISFTSDKNPTPESIQVILRTNEISIEDTVDKNLDLETEKADIGFWGRIKNLFNKILSIFRHISL